MAIDKNIGRKIKYLRKKQNITQTDLGQAVFDKSKSACQNTIKNIETGRRNTKAEELSTILKELDVTDSEFNELNLSGEPEPLPLSDSDTKKDGFFPEISYYSNLFKQASEAGDDYMILQIYKSMAQKINEKINAIESNFRESDIEHK